MEEMVTSVKRVTDITKEITHASQEQTVGIEHINETINRMNEVTQQNAALVEEAATAAESLQKQAAELTQIISIFEVGAARSGTATIAPMTSPMIRREDKSMPVKRVASTSRPGPARPSQAFVHPAERSTCAALGGGDWEEF